MFFGGFAWKYLKFNVLNANREQLYFDKLHPMK